MSNNYFSGICQRMIQTLRILARHHDSYPRNRITGNGPRHGGVPAAIAIVDASLGRPGFSALNTATPKDPNGIKWKCGDGPHPSDACLHGWKMRCPALTPMPLHSWFRCMMKPLKKSRFPEQDVCCRRADPSVRAADKEKTAENLTAPRFFFVRLTGNSHRSLLTT